MAAGDFDERFPTDLELTRHYEVSRHTVREAVSALGREGLVSRVRGRGTVVAHGRFEQRLGALYSLFAEIESTGVEQTSKVLGIGIAPDAGPARRLGLPEGSEVFRLDRLRMAGDCPLAIDRAWLPPDVGRPLLDADFSHTALYDELDKRCGYRPDNGWERITPVVPDNEVRSMLEMSHDDAAFRVEAPGPLRRPGHRMEGHSDQGRLLQLLRRLVDRICGQRWAPVRPQRLTGQILATDEIRPATMDPLAERQARILHDSFVEFHDRFLEVSHRAAGRFLESDWVAHQDDATERLDLHKDLVGAAVDACRLTQPEDKRQARSSWIETRRRYVELIASRVDLELAETFYNSVTRRLFGIIGLDPELEFLWLGPTALPVDDGITGEYRIFPIETDTADAMREVMQHSPLAEHLDDLERDSARVARRIDEYLGPIWDGIDSIEMLRPVFYRNKGAYLVGRVRWLNRVSPLIIPLVSTESGASVDAVILTEWDASRLFGYTRSYFHVLCRRPAAVVGFVKSLLPVKPVAELYTSIGYSQHGKTNLFRALYRHMDHSNTRFERARGVRGMVMAVFTLPSFDVVFKIIKDRFPPSKHTTADEVKRRYKLVFDHDRVGRLVDAQEFENLSFQRDRFDADLLDELRTECARLVTITADEVILHHVYTERRLYPLDLYLREMSRDRARAAAIDYGNAVKDLAAANIFPGDLFPKNFGVTRHGSVVFYDYDELTLLSEVNFREVPVSNNYDDDLYDQPWFPVAPNDVFPEEFRTFLRSPSIIAEVIDTRHSDICTAAFWNGMKDQHEAGELPDFFPYPDEVRFIDG